jgi:hypothetical protein
VKQTLLNHNVHQLQVEHAQVARQVADEVCKVHVSNQCTAAQRPVPFCAKLGNM